jgi:hypothetical protein
MPNLPIISRAVEAVPMALTLRPRDTVDFIR